MAKMRIGSVAQDDLANALAALTGLDSGLLEIYGSTYPGSITDAPGGSPLVVFTLNAAAFGAAVSGTITAGAIGDESALATGTAVWTRVRNAGDTVTLWDNDDVSTGGTQIVLNTLDIVIGATVSVTSWTVTMPSSETP